MVSDAAACRAFLSGGESQTHCATRTSLQCPMHGACIPNEVCARPRMTEKELVREQVSLESVTASARRHEVSRRVRPAPCDRDDVIQRGKFRRQSVPAIDASASTVAHRGALEGALPGTGAEPSDSACDQASHARAARRDDSGVTASRHCTSLEKTTPRSGTFARAGCRETAFPSEPAEDGIRRVTIADLHCRMRYQLVLLYNCC